MLTIKRIPEDIRTRRGRVLIDAITLDKHPEDILSVLIHFIVVRAEHLYSSNKLEYQGYCHLFEPIPLGEEMPTYDFILTRNWRGQVATTQVTKQQGD